MGPLRANLLIGIQLIALCKKKEERVELGRIHEKEDVRCLGICTLETMIDGGFFSAKKTPQKKIRCVRDPYQTSIGKRQRRSHFQKAEPHSSSNCRFFTPGAWESQRESHCCHRGHDDHHDRGPGSLHGHGSHLDHVHGNPRLVHDHRVRLGHGQIVP